MKRTKLSPLQSALRDVVQLTDETAQQATKLGSLLRKIEKLSSPKSSPDELAKAIEQATRIELEIFQRSDITTTLVRSLTLPPKVRAAIDQCLQFYELRERSTLLSSELQTLETKLREWK